MVSKRSLLVPLLAFLPNLLAVDPPSRSYFSPILNNNTVYVVGGSKSSLNVYSLDLTSGLSTGSPPWAYSVAPDSSLIKPYERGVAFLGANNKIFIQGGFDTTTQVRSMVSYTPTSISTGNWKVESVISSTGSNPPGSKAMMTASIDPSTNIAYYYGGISINSDGVTPIYPAGNQFYTFNTNTGTWTDISPNYPPKERYGRLQHSSVLVNNQLFIFGGVTVPVTNGSQGNATHADFESVLVYDIKSNTAISMATTGDIPPDRLGSSAVAGLDGKSIVIYGGYNSNVTSEFESTTDVYVLDTCSLSWSKPSTQGTNPGPLAGHGAVTYGNYMIVLLGQSNYTIGGGNIAYNTGISILDMSSWKWVDSIPQGTSSSTTKAASCSFSMPDVSGPLNYDPFNYDQGIVVNPSTTQSKVIKKKEGLGIGFGLLLLLLIVGAAYYFIRRSRRRKNLASNPRWARYKNANPTSYRNDSDYPLYVYSKEDEEQARTPAAAFAPNDVKTYTTTDHEQWEQQISQNGENPFDPQEDIWKRMRSLNDGSNQARQQPATRSNLIDTE
ncbi:galactose oxidase [Backusella circina FSU 941]|nr:galactose oxidase [Backusella circina FSU 941]